MNGSDTSTSKRKPVIDWESFVIPSERGKHVEEYMKEMRDNDRDVVALWSNIEGKQLSKE